MLQNIQLQHTIPDRLVIAGARGNGEMPQTHGPATIYAGKLVTELLMRRELDLDTFVQGEPTLEQITTIAGAMNARHAHYGVQTFYDPSKLEGTPPTDRVPGQYRLLNTEELVSSTKNAIHNVAKSIGAFARMVVANPTTPDSPAPINVEASYFRDRPYILELLNNPAHKPKLEALLAMWTMADDLLRTPAVLGYAEAYRLALSESYPYIGRVALVGMQYMTRTLTDALASKSARRTIKAQTGFEVSKNVAEEFARHVADLNYPKRAH